MDTISRNALGVEQCVYYTYAEFAIVYLDRGIMVTQVGEGARLFQGEGLDPTLNTAHVSTAGAWVIPGATDLRLICDGTSELTEITCQPVRFILQLHGYPIAVGSLEQIRRWRDVHQRLMQKYAISPEAMAILALRENLSTTLRAISAQLKQASLHPQFPGRCPFCPGS